MYSRKEKQRYFCQDTKFRSAPSQSYRTNFEKIKLPIFCSAQLLGVFFKSVIIQSVFPKCTTLKFVLNFASLNIFCLLSSTAYAVLPFDSGWVTVCTVQSCGLLSFTVLSRHHSIHSSCSDPAKIFCGFDSLKICESTSSGSRQARTKTKRFLECIGENLFKTVEKS